MDYGGSPPNPNYSPSLNSSPPPGMGGASYAGGASHMGGGASHIGGGASNINYNQNYQGQQTQGSGCCQGGCVATMVRVNPYTKINTATDDIYFNLRYKRAMVSSLVVVAVGIVGSAVVTSEGCAFINFVSFFHLIPILAPMCNKTVTPFIWAMISFFSIIASIVTIFFGLIQGCATEAAVIGGAMIAIELLSCFFFYKMDPLLKEKMKGCFASCGCFGEEAQLQTMVPKESGYPTSHPGGYPPNAGYGYDGASQMGGGGASAYNQSPQASGANYNDGTLKSNASGHNPFLSDAEQNNNNTMGRRSSNGKGAFFMDAPDKFDTASRPGY